MKIADEISSYFKHNDFSLAGRRLLDACFDTGDAALIREGINWSSDFRKYEAESNNKSCSAELITRADELIHQIVISSTDIPVFESPLVVAGNISKTYPSGQFSLKPIDVEVRPGNIIGVVGENGNGKTTLLRCLAGQLATDGGSIAYTQLQNPDYFDVKHTVAFIPQRIPKWYGMLKDNLHFSASIAGIYENNNDLLVDFMVERLGLGKYIHLTWNQISSGYRTRFEIARVLLQKPSLLILDEPLANLDIKAQQTILTDLKFLTKSARSPMGVILSSQQLHEVEKVADKVLFIKDGKCLFKTNEPGANSASVQNVIELETKTTRDELAKILGNDIMIQFNGGFYTVTSSALSVQQMIGKLIENDITISYFRDITHSTKRFF